MIIEVGEYRRSVLTGNVYKMLFPISTGRYWKVMGCTSGYDKELHTLGLKEMPVIAKDDEEYRMYLMQESLS